MYSRQTSVYTQLAGRPTIVFSGDISSTRQHYNRGTPLNRRDPSTTLVDAAYCYRLSRVVSPSVRLSVCLSVIVLSPAKTAEPIEMPFEIWTRGRVHTGTTWRIPLNRPCADAMRPAVKLL